MNPDIPEWEGMELVVPFVVCTSKGGPFDDDAFVAGFQCGEVDKALSVAAVAGATHVKYTVRTALIPQLELLAMHRGFLLTAETIGETDDHAAMPEWSVATFERPPW